MQEIEGPELAQKRMKEIYKLKGYSDDWIEKRVRGIAIRDELTDEWGKRGIKTKSEYSILTAEISKARFGLTPGEYKKGTVAGIAEEELERRSWEKVVSSENYLEVPENTKRIKNKKK